MIGSPQFVNVQVEVRSAPSDVGLFTDEVHHPETGAVGHAGAESIVTNNQSASTHTAFAHAVLGVADVIFLVTNQE